MLQSFKKETEPINSDGIKIRVTSKSGARTSTNTRASQGGMIVSGTKQVQQAKFKQQSTRSQLQAHGQSIEPTYNNRVAKAHAELQQFFAKFDSESAQKPKDSGPLYSHVAKPVL